MQQKSAPDRWAGGMRGGEGMLEFLMRHPIGTPIVSSIIGSALGVLLAFKVLIPAIVQA